MEKKAIKVNIFGFEYALRSDMEPEYLEELASYVDGKMKQLGESVQSKSQQKIAVLAALNIADEYFRLKRKHEKLVKEIEATSEKITENLDEYLSHYSQLIK
ncbi:MAG: hypothetical protein Kow0037_07810 [Calditrichia bacterium]